MPLSAQHCPGRHHHDIFFLLQDNLNISRSALYELIRSHQVRSVTVGRTRLITHQALTDYVADLERQAA